MSEDNKIEDEDGQWVTFDLDADLSEEEETEEVIEDQTEDEDEVQEEETEVVEDKKEKRKSRAQERIRQLVQEKKDLEAKLRQEQEEKDKISKETSVTKKESLSSQERMIDSSIENTRRELRRAIEDGDVELQLELNDKLQDLKVDKRIVSAQASKFKDVDEDKKENTQKQPQQIQIPEEMQYWLEENTWAINPTSREERKKIALVREISNELIKEGYAETEADFYEELDDQLKKRFGKSGKDGVESKEDKDSSSRTENAQQDSKKSATVSGSSKTPASRKGKVVLTPEERRMAKRLGVPEDRYARQKQLRETKMSTGGWVEVN